ncbi:MAG TPA: hypothetical protein PKK99_15940, partial [Bacteroidia bacterium]|nr:hypothetical protein [Bacteroidia bacterium]
VPYQIIYDIGLLPNANYACLCENRMYLLDSLGNLLDSINYYGPGSVSAFSNGDLFVNTNSFKGRIQINGSVVWQTSDSLLTRDTNIVALRNDTLHFLNPMTGLSFTSIPFTQNGDNKALLMKDGGWCTYNSTTIQRFDTNGQLKWQESVTLAHFGIQLIVEQSNGSLLTGGTYLYQDCNYNEYDFSSFIGTIDTLGKSIMDSTYQVWPGDGDDNGISEFGDLVYIALAQGSTGPSRIDTSSIFWNSYFCVGDIATNFPHCFAIGVNHQQCDAVSDGIIDSIDIVGFGDYSSTFNSTITPWRISNPDVHKSQSILPYFSLIPDKDTVNAGDSIRVAIVIGGNGVSVDSIFGLAF